MGDSECGFCRLDRFRAADVYLENEHCVFFASSDPSVQAEAGLPPDVLPGSGVVVPIVHRRSPFQLTAAEWVATHDLLVRARAALHEWLAPDGYTLGWNDQARLHAHLHVLPRFEDEPKWDQGVRSAVKGTDNRRPDPWRPGTGRPLLEP
ncbi:HIT family protein [Flindersiella endophytica]